jgi:hypothetical protein
MNEDEINALFFKVLFILLDNASDEVDGLDNSIEAIERVKNKLLQVKATMNTTKDH